MLAVPLLKGRYARHRRAASLHARTVSDVYGRCSEVLGAETGVFSRTTLEIMRLLFIAKWVGN